MSASSKTRVAVNGRRRGGGRVLIVDDDDNTREVLREVCEAWGHEVMSASNGTEAITLLPPFDPDVVLLDLGLPIMDGIEVARRIRDIAGYGTFIIAFTGWTERHDREGAMRAGCNLYYFKPADLTELEDILASVTEQRARLRNETLH
jgi:CheY-like chemotaxis protein